MKNDHDMDEEDDSKIFPQRLMEVLCDERNADAICWLPHGRAFMIRNRQLFAERVMPRYGSFPTFRRSISRAALTFLFQVLPTQSKVLQLHSQA